MRLSKQSVSQQLTVAALAISIPVLGYLMLGHPALAWFVGFLSYTTLVVAWTTGHLKTR